MTKTEDEVLAEFRSLFGWKAEGKVTAKSWAAEHGFSPAYVSDVLNGKRGIADRMAEELGYLRVVSFHPVRKQKP